MELLLLFFFITLWFGFLSLKKEKGGRYSTIFIFGLGVLLYFFSIPLEMAINGQTYYRLGSLWVELGTEERIMILIMSILSLLGFIVGLYLSRFTIRVPLVSTLSSRSPKHVACHKKDFRNALLGIWFLSGFIVFIIYNDSLKAMNTYQSAYAQNYSSPLFSYFLGQFYICSSIIAGLALWRRTPRGYVLGSCLLFVIFVLALYTSSKDPILLALLGLASAMLGGKRIGSVKILFLVLFAFPVVLLILPLFSVFRSGIPISLEATQLLGNYMSFTKIDPAGPMNAISHHIMNPSPLRLGVTYITSAGILIPKILWPGRPLDLSEQFAREQITNWMPGQGLGFSPLAEALINFGILGAFLHFLLFAMLWGWGWRLAQRSIFKYKEEQFLIFYQVVGFYALILSFRGPLISSLKVLIIFIVPYVVVFYSIRMARLTVRSKPLGSKG